jgi:hypothetical protein
MTKTQLHIADLLLRGHYIRGISSGYRVYAPNVMPVAKLGDGTFRRLKDLLRKDKQGRWLIDKRAIRRLNGNAGIKKLYKKLLANGRKG